MPAAVSAACAPGALLLLDGDLIVLDSNGMAERWTGRTREEVVGHPLHELLSPGAGIFLETHGRPLLHAGEALGEIALDLRHARGETHPVLLFAHMDTAERRADRRVHVLLVSARQRAAYERELRRMRDGARTARRQSELLRHVTQAAAGARTAHEVAASTLELMRRGARADRAVFVALDAGAPEVLHAEPAHEHPSARLVTTLAGAAAPAVHAGLGEDGGSVVVLPALVGDETIGAIALDVPAQRRPGEAELAILEGCAHQCGQALHRARLFEELERRSGQQAMVARLGERALGGDTPAELFAQATELLAAALPADLVTVTDAEGALRASSGAPAVSGAAHRSVSIPVGPADAPHGVLAAHRRSDPPFSTTDADLAQATANVLWNAIERHRVHEDAERRAAHDALTGLPNRALLLRRIDEAIARMSPAAGYPALLFVDLDHFKLINDTLGHEAGDALLRDLAPRLTRAVRPDDTVARLGGDEFVVLCPAVDGAGAAERVADRIVAALERPFRIAGADHWVRASIGVVVAEPGVSASELLRNADAAMYRAKERGRGRRELYDHELRANAERLLNTERELRRALQEDQIRVVFQPLVRLADERIVAVEALARWDHPERGVVSPGEFIPVAEESGLIVALGEHVLRTACRQLCALRAAGPATAHLRMTVNVSVRQLLAPGFVATVASALADAGLDGADGLLGLEITESLLVDPRDDAAEVLRALRSLGVRILIDDFGTGFSSLDRLRRYPIDALKIDRSFVAGLGERDPRADTALVAAILAMAEALGLDVIAEGVETPEQRDRLLALGCPQAQGFLFARPLPAAEVVVLAASGGRALA